MHIVEIKGVDFKNKGAELMLHAAVAACRQSALDLEPAVALRRGTPRQRRQAGARHLLRFGTPRLAGAEAVLSVFTRLVPAALLRHTPYVREQDVAAVLDASGFAYSDQWAPAIGEASLRHLRRWKRPDRPVVLLPQAFGPFETPASRAVMTELLEVADLVYARDRVSYDHVKHLGAGGTLRLAPDFTNLVAPPAGLGGPDVDDRVVIVPNLRMVDVGQVVGRDAYVGLLAGAAQRVAALGHGVAVLAHEDGDAELVREIAGRARVDAVTGRSALALKSMLGRARLVVSSRFHGLVNALSQATPAIGLGWSHKYAELFREYGVVDCLAAPDVGVERLSALLVAEVGDEAQAERRRNLAARSATLKARSAEMWREVFELLGRR